MPAIILPALLSVCLWLSAAPAALASAAFIPANLRCEYLRNPLGIDTPQPRLSWLLQPENGSSRDLRQTAFQILAASTLEHLKAGRGDLWDSGKMESDQSIQVRYAGRPLGSEQACFWRVRAWDQDGTASDWSEPAHWSMGLLRPADWQGGWIGLDGEATARLFQHASWIWFPEGHPEKSAPIGTRWFRKLFSLPADRPLKNARWLVTADNEFVAYLNGEKIGTGNNFKAASGFNVPAQLHPGTNVLAVSVKNVGTTPNPAGLAARLELQFETGDDLSIETDETWQSTAEEFPGWQTAGYDDSTWLPAKKLGPVGMEPWGDVAGPEDRRLPARWLRKDFALDRPVRRATAYVCGLGLSELYLNGKRASDDVLSPGLTEYARRVFYVTHDVTGLLKAGPNAAGVILGNGRFFAPRAQVPTPTRGYGFPKLRFQLVVDYTDGSRFTVVSDPTWDLTTAGPIQANNEYDGESYDARLEMPGWAEPGFTAEGWQKAQLVAAPEGALTAQMIEPIRVTQTLKPIALSEPKPGTYIFDMGQNMVGWCRLKVSAPRGTTITLRHAETLVPDGTLYLDNLRSAKVTDTYICKGNGHEVYEPRFTYHGFRYVELTGFPGKPSLSTLEGRVVHDDLEPAGEFACANPLLNRIYSNVLWGVRGNYRSIPTDCPQRDERQGWLGDRSAECKGETYLFNTAALYAKWLRDMADAQKDTGSVPDVCPSYWPIYSDNVTWPSSTVIIPGTLYEQFADAAVVAEHYASARKWLRYMTGFVTNGIISRDSYGDWCVPPEDPKLIHSKDPARKTNPALLATAYFYLDARLMARYARLLGKTDDAAEFLAVADKLQSAFNANFFYPKDCQYDNGSQTSCVLPLAFGLVPVPQAMGLFDHLVRKIEVDTHGHIGTGLIGGQWLMRTLTDNGRPDLAYSLAAQKTYPSWGYMVEKGATTIWELWNGDTADPAMNSGNHVMLVGDLTTWLFENLAGIKPNPAQPGFKQIVMRPEPVAGLAFVRATHRSPFGLIASEWHRDSDRFSWTITVPPNTTATALVPVTAGQIITESGKHPDRSPGITPAGAEPGRLIYQLGSGNYQFEVK